MPAYETDKTTLITSQQLADAKQGRYAISKDVVYARIDPYVWAASERVRGWVGDAVYDEALAADESLLVALSASDKRRVKARWAVLATVEAELAISYLLPNLNTFVTPEGMLLEARSEGQVTHRYLTPEQTRQMAELFFNRAYSLVTPYLLEGATPAAEFEFAEVICA